MGVFLSKYARSGHNGVFFVQNLKVFIFRILKNYVCKSVKFESVQKSSALLRESARLRYYGLFCLQFLKVSTLRILKNSVCKSAYSVVLVFALLGSFA